MIENDQTPSFALLRVGKTMRRRSKSGVNNKNFNFLNQIIKITGKKRNLDLSFMSESCLRKMDLVNVTRSDRNIF